jgi:hypothetical protein
VAVWNGDDLLWTTATFLAWAALVALGIAWGAHAKFRSLLSTRCPGERHMSPVWEQRSHRCRGIGLATYGVSILLFIAWIVSWTVF